MANCALIRCNKNSCGQVYNNEITDCNAHANNAIYYVQTMQHVNELFCNGTSGGWSNGDVTAATGGTLAAGSSALTGFFTSGTSHATYYIGTDQHVYELFWNGSAWTDGDLTVATGGALAIGGSPLASFTTTGASHATYYVGTNQHVYELFWNGSSWTNGDITSAAGGTLVSGGSGLTSFTTTGVGHAVYYVGTNQHVYELYWTGSAWTNGDVTTATGATLAASNSALTSFVTPGSSHATYYVGTDQHVHELYWTGSAWTTGDVTTAAGGNSAGSTALTSFTSAGNPHTIFYVDTSQHVGQLNWTGTAWTSTDVTAAAGAVLVSSGSGLTSFDIADSGYLSNQYRLVYYVGTNQNVYELAWNGSSWANTDLTSTLALSTSALSSWVSQ